MKLVKLYESVLIEGKSMSCLVKFGNELFDPQLSKGGDVETNTPTEDSYIKLINQFTSKQHGKALRPEFIAAMKTLKSCMSYYPEVLQPEGVVYRGSVMVLNDLLAQYEDIEDDLSKGGIFDFNYSPKSPIQSWTTDKDAAEDFTKVSPFLLQMINTYKKIKDDPKALANFAKEISNNLDDITVPIVISLNSNTDDFLFKSKYFNKLSQHDYEDELLRINTQTTRVTGEITPLLFDSVFGILKAIKQYEVHVNQR